MTWTYLPDGKLKTRKDDGVSVGQQVVLVDNSDFNNTITTGAWTTANTGNGRYRSHLRHPRCGNWLFRLQLAAQRAAGRHVPGVRPVPGGL
jgi:hypothetical protein